MEEVMVLSLTEQGKDEGERVRETARLQLNKADWG